VVCVGVVVWLFLNRNRRVRKRIFLNI
jgi:hypothetical protein